MQATRTATSSFILNMMRSSLIGLMLCVCAMAAYAQDNPQEKALVDEIWKARAEKNTEVVAAKVEELKQLNAKNEAIALNELWVKDIKTAGQTDSPLKQPDNWVPKVTPTPVPTPRATPVPQPIIFDANSGSWTDKALGYVKAFKDLSIYWHAGAGAFVLVIIILIIVAIKRRKKAEPKEVSAESLLGGTLSSGSGLSPLGGLSPSAGNDFNIPSLDPLADAQTEPLIETPAQEEKVSVPAPASANMPAAGSMTDSTVNLFKSFETNMDDFTKKEDTPTTEPAPKNTNISMDDFLKQEAQTENDPPTESIKSSGPTPDIDLTALFAQDPNGSSESTTAKDIPAANNVDLTAMFAPEPQKPAIPSIAPQAKTPSDNVDLTALFAQDPLGTPGFDEDPFGKPAESDTTDEGGEAFYQEQIVKAKQAIADGKYKEAINYLSIVTALNPDDLEAQSLLKEAQSKL